jgi:7-cyano-7-deazaguanine reductase
MTTRQKGSPLGKATAYPDRYDPSLLFSIDRAEARRALSLGAALPFSGADLWTAHEVTWLDSRGKPQVATGEFRVGADSPAIVESKSVKLYLGSFAQEHVGLATELAGTIKADLTRACGADVGVRLLAASAMGVAELPGESIDAIEIAGEVYRPHAALLRHGAVEVDEALRSALFRCNCPVTGQPDYADILVRYRGPRLDREALLKYLVSYREHAAFHEACVERIFIDIARMCGPKRLTVYARFLRRGGIDINPFRSNFEQAPDHGVRSPRQ